MQIFAIFERAITLRIKNFSDWGEFSAIVMQAHAKKSAPRCRGIFNDKSSSICVDWLTYHRAVIYLSVPPQLG